MQIPVWIRRATKEDGRGADAVERAAFPAAKHTPGSRAVAPVTARVPQDRVVARAGGKTVGTVRLDFQDDRIHLVRLAVHPAHQRSGVAQQIVRYLADHGQSLRLRALSLYAVRATGNVPIFERLGFREITPSGQCIQPGCEDEVYMELGID